MIKLISIDGPAKSGKGTIAARLAQKLGFVHFDTGNYYRAVAAIMLEHGLEDAVAAAEKFGPPDLERTNLRHPDVEGKVSKISGIYLVREILNGHLRRAIAEMESGAVIDGRAGAREFPEAAVKIFLTADVGVRAQRAHAIAMEKARAKGEGTVPTYGAILAKLRERDEDDMTRTVAPLMRNPGPEHYTRVIDNTDHQDIEETLDHILRVCEEVLAA